MTRNDVARNIAIATLVLSLGQPELAFSQALPWQTPGGGQAQQAQPPQHTHHKSQNNTNTASSGENTRDADDHQLNQLASRFYGIHVKDKDSVAKLKKLEHEVSSFNATLKTKSYDADILKDAEHLESRITRQRKEWEAAQTPAPPVAAPVTAVTTSPALPAPTTGR